MKTEKITLYFPSSIKKEYISLEVDAERILEDPILGAIYIHRATYGDGTQEKTFSASAHGLRLLESTPNFKSKKELATFITEKLSRIPNERKSHCLNNWQSFLKDLKEVKR